MSMRAERELAIAKENFQTSIDSFSPLKFIQEKPIMAAGIALAAGAVLGMSRFSKIKTLLLCPPVLGLVKKAIDR